MNGTQECLWGVLVLYDVKWVKWQKGIVDIHAGGLFTRDMVRALGSAQLGCWGGWHVQSEEPSCTVFALSGAQPRVGVLGHL